MLLSKYFCPIIKENPKEASIISHKLMLKAGLIRQTSSGIYIWLPLGLKVLDKISAIIKQEMDNSGSNNILMPTIQGSDLWKESGRYEDYGLEMLRIKDRHGREMLYGPTNEEQITDIFRYNITSYKQLPLNLYQIQWKFRDEIRPRFGVMRGREFLMKDGYSFDLTQEDAEISYKKMFTIYLKIFQNMGLKAIPMQADTGPIGGDLSHEFLILADKGESEVFCDKRLLDLSLKEEVVDYGEIYNQYTLFYAATAEKHNPNDKKYKDNKEHVIKKRGIEIGHIFYFATKYSKIMNAKLLNRNHEDTFVHMGSYGIGVSRLVGAIIEANHDERGIIWPKAVAPFSVIITSLSKNDDVNKLCNEIYSYLKKNYIDVLFNDLDDTAGSKLATTDLLGIPYKITVGNQTIKNKEIDIEERRTRNINKVSLNNISEILKIVRF